MASPGGPRALPTHSACSHCRSQKVRCIPDESNPRVCQRCVRSGRPCIFTEVRKRKQRKRTDTRVAELEREMSNMRAALKRAQETSSSSSAAPAEEAEPSPAEESEEPRPDGVWYTENVPDAQFIPSQGIVRPSGSYQSETTVGTDGGHHGSRDASMRSSPSIWPDNHTDRIRTDRGDVIDIGLLSMTTARQLVETYKHALFPHYPLVFIPDEIKADELRRTKPTLFLAIIAAAAGKDHPTLSERLDQHVLQTYANRSILSSEKSLEIVQALLTSALWYHPPTKFGDLKYYEYIHMAATMCMDIGIGMRPVRPRTRFGKGSKGAAGVHPAEDSANPDLSMAPRSRDSLDTASLESRRTYLSCYIICSAVSLSLRRPNMLHITSYIRDCADHLEHASDALPFDRTVVAWVRLIMIGEEISTSFSYDDPGGIASISDLGTRLMLHEFEKRLAAWLNYFSDLDMDGALIIMYHTVRLYLYEVGLHVDHSPDDFKAPYQMGVVQPYEGPDIPTPILAHVIAGSISSSQELLDTFLVMDVESLRAVPVFTYVRVSFAAFVLTKLCLSASHPRSRISGVLDRNNLGVEKYMDRSILHVRDIIGPSRCRLPAIFLALLFKLREWCTNPPMIRHEDAPELSPSEDTTPDSLSNHPRSARAIEGPRFVEVSSTENSPQVFPNRQESQSSTYDPRSPSSFKDRVDGDSATLWTNTELQKPDTDQAESTLPQQHHRQQQPQPQHRQRHNTESIYPTTSPQVPVANMTTTTGPSGTATTTYPDPSIPTELDDQMQIDGKFMDFWNEICGGYGYPTGVLNGMDDWTTAAPAPAPGNMEFGPSSSNDDEYRGWGDEMASMAFGNLQMLDGSQDPLRNSLRDLG